MLYLTTFILGIFLDNIAWRFHENSWRIFMRWKNRKPAFKVGDIVGYKDIEIWECQPPYDVYGCQEILQVGEKNYRVKNLHVGGGRGPFGLGNSDKLSFDDQHHFKFISKCDDILFNEKFLDALNKDDL